MDILIYGAGAVGGYLGARLAQQQHNVTLIAREVMANLISETGLEVTEDGERVVTHPTAVTSVAQAFKDGQQYDLIILAMKAYDINSSIDPLIAFCPEPRMILTTQNGIGLVCVDDGLVEARCGSRVEKGERDPSVKQGVEVARCRDTRRDE